MNIIMEKFLSVSPPISVDFGIVLSSLCFSNALSVAYADYVPKIGAINLLYFTGVLDNFIC